MRTGRQTAAAMRLIGGIALLICAIFGSVERANAQLELIIDDANISPLPVALTPFEPATPAMQGVADDIVSVVEADLASTGLFRIIPKTAFVAAPADFNSAPAYADWRVINADALVTGRIEQASDGRLLVQFRVFDTTAQEQIEGLHLLSDPSDWRRVAHKVADGIYAKLTGEGPYFDSRIVFVDETGPKGDRRKRLAIMDQDGANLRYLPGADGLVLTPRFAPNDQSVLYISYATGEPQVYLTNLDTGQREILGTFPGMSFAPRFSPDGGQVVLSLSQDGNTDLFIMRLADRQLRRLTTNPAIDTSASFSPDGSQIVFESDRGGSQQLYIMPVGGGPAQRISFGEGNYGTPVWSPRGDIVAFTKIIGGRFHIGAMRTDGTSERLLSTGFLVEGPTFSPNGRVIAFFREDPGENSRARLMSIDITGNNLRVIETPNAASDPAWSPVRK